MFRVDVPSAASTLPVPAAVGTPGYFTGGNAGTGVLATVLPADWANSVQEEIANTVTAANIVLSKTTNTQLRDAIRILATLAVQQGSYAVDFGTANTIQANPVLAAGAMFPGLVCSIKVAATNTGATTLNIGAGVYPVLNNGAPLSAGTLAANEIYVFEYDGANFELVSPGVSASIPSASTSQAGIVALATAAEALAGTNTSKAITAADLAAALSASAVQTTISGTTITKTYASGLIELSAYASVPSTSASLQSIVFPTAFPNACVHVIAQIEIPAALNGNNMALEHVRGTLSRTGFSVQLQTPNSGGAATSGVYYTAQGN